MRIFAIGRNYAEHIQELNNERPYRARNFYQALIRLSSEITTLFIFPIFRKTSITKLNWYCASAKKEKTLKKNSLTNI
jgi:2-keto-4-pentenoate hydratase/2-oxohepta-3-ene-1,7-dioic acid hydratase in catechol pathway